MDHAEYGESGEGKPGEGCGRRNMDANDREHELVETGYGSGDESRYNKKKKREKMTMEMILTATEVPSWKKQLTIKCLRGELCVERHVQLHSDEAQPHHRDHSFTECLCWAVGVLLYEDVDQDSREIWDAEGPIH